MTTQKKIGIFILLFILVAFSGFIAWSNNVMEVQENAKAAMKGSESVQVVTDEGFLEFVPSEGNKEGIIFYPGAKVSPRAYAPVMLELAQKGFLTVIVPMPLNLAFFGADRALNVMEKYPGINTWTIAGHSLGGAMACKFASEHAEKVDQLILLAAYTTKSFDLSDSGIPVLSVSASKDGLTTPEKINKNKPFLPPDTVYFEIEGGNHAQFGDYGMQFGDGKADINGTKQIRLTVEQILVFLEG